MGKRQLQYLLVFLLVACAVFTFQAVAWGAPAATKEFTAKQPSGQSFKITQKGNEWFNWIETSTGDVVIQESNGYWFYAGLKNGDLVSTGVKYLVDPRPATPLTAAKLSSWLNAPANSDVLNAPQAKPGPSKVDAFTMSAASAKGNGKIVVLLVETPGNPITSQLSHWQNIFFNDDEGAKSVVNFYKEQSGGQLTMSAATEREGTPNDGIITVSVSQAHPNSGGNTNNNNKQLVRNAILAADKDIDFDIYDTDLNGKISNDELHIVTVIAGYEASMYGTPSPKVWGHQWDLWGFDTTADGVSLGNYSGNGGYVQIGELHGVGSPATLGIIVHELGHMYNLPDLYDTDGGSDGIGDHSLMSGGSWGALSGQQLGSTPVGFDAYSKVRLDWITPTVHQSGSGSYTLKSLDTDQFNILKVSTSNPDQYFLLENRQFQGTYDVSLDSDYDSGGISIWHIDASQTTNKNQKRRLVDLEEANDDVQNPYYYSGRYTLFDKSTKPSSALYPKGDSKITIVVNSENGDEMSVKVVNANADSAAPSVPSNFAASSIAYSTFTLSWTASTDDLEVKEYQIFRNNKLFATTSGTTYNVTGQIPNTTYTMTVKAVDYTGKASAVSTAVSVKTLLDTTPPDAPTGVDSKNETQTSFTLTWEPAEDNAFVAKYEVYLDGVLAGSVSALFNYVNLTNLIPGKDYSVTVKAVDISNNVSAASTAATLSPLDDENGPSAPQSVRITKVTNVSFQVDWAASVDNVALAGYNLYLGETKLNTSLITKTTYAVTGQTANTQLAVTVVAVDTAGNESTGNVPITFTTPNNSGAGPTLAVKSLTNVISGTLKSPTLTYTLAAPATVTLKIINSSGTATTLVNGVAKLKGSFSENLDAGFSLLNGNYYLEISATSAGNTSKILLSFKVDRYTTPSITNQTASTINSSNELSFINFTLSKRAKVTVTIKQGSTVVKKVIANNIDRGPGVLVFTFDGWVSKKLALTDGTYLVEFKAVAENGGSSTQFALLTIDRVQ